MPLYFAFCGARMIINYGIDISLLKKMKLFAIISQKTEQ